MTRVRTSLARHITSSSTDTVQLDRMAAAAWRDHHKVIVSPHDTDLADLERAWVRAIGDRRYGRKEARG